jgi:hypothetical protein
MTHYPTEDEARQRIEELADDGQTVHDILLLDTTDARAFYAVARTWSHPDEPGLSILCLQVAQLTADWADLTDTFLSGSTRLRYTTGDGNTARSLAQSLAATAARIDADAEGRPANYNEVDG